MEDVFRFLAAEREENRKQMLEMVAELKKPTAREQKKIDEEDARYLRAEQEKRALALIEIQRRENNQKNCPHVRVHAGTKAISHTWRGQVHTPDGQDPYWIPVCTQCLTTLPKIKATPNQVREGLNLNQYTGVTLEGLLKLAQQVA